MLTFYVLEGRTPRAASLEEWRRWFDDVGARRVARDEVGGVLVSTIMMPMPVDRGPRGTDFFETMAFDADGEAIPGWTRRYRTYDEAEAGHRAALAALRGADGA